MRLPWGPRGWQESGTRASVADSIDSDVSEEGHRRFHTAPARYGVRSGQLKRRSLPPIWEVADRFHEEPDRSAIDDPSAASQRRERLRDEAQSSACAFLQRERDLLARLPQSIGRGGSGADKLWSEVADFKREALAERARLQRLCQASDIAGRRGTEPPLESLLVAALLLQRARARAVVRRVRALELLGQSIAGACAGLEVVPTAAGPGAVALRKARRKLPSVPGSSRPRSGS